MRQLETDHRFKQAERARAEEIGLAGLLRGRATKTNEPEDAMPLFLIANLVTTSKALGTRSDALVPSSMGRWRCSSVFP